MVRVNNFLWCFPLETGGVCLGWFFFSTFFVITSLIFVFGGMSIISKPHPLYTLVWLDIIIFLIIVVYSSWLMVRGIKTKNPAKIQPFRIIFIAAIFLLTGNLIHSIYHYFRLKQPKEGSISFDKDIFEIIENDFKLTRIVLNAFFLVSSIYIFIFVDSLHKTIKEFRRRFYVAVKL